MDLEVATLEAGGEAVVIPEVSIRRLKQTFACIGVMKWVRLLVA